MTEKRERKLHWQKRRGGGKDLEGFENFIALALVNGPLTKEEIHEKFVRFGAHFGAPTQLMRDRHYHQGQQSFDSSLDHLLWLGLITADAGGVYRLTEEGAEEARELDKGVQKFAAKFNAIFSRPATASKVSVVINALLSALKLAVGLLFNSMALLADGFDNLVDVLSAVMVYLGIKHNKELYSTMFIVAMMFATAGFIGREAVRRLVLPEPVEATALAIAAAATSGGICYLLSLYQHTVGKQSGSLSLISQSIDSKNHVFVAIAALVGIIFARSGIFLVDSIVALAVAILILKSAIELAAETVKVAKGEKLDLTKFGRAEEKLYERFRRRYLKKWMLFSLTQKHSKAEMVAQYNRSFSTAGLPIVDQFSFVKGFDFDKHVDSLLKELIDEGLVIATDSDYELTAKGRKVLKKRLASQRYMEI